MSTKPHSRSSSTPESSTDRDAEQLFDDLPDLFCEELLSNREICSCCFAKVRSVNPPPSGVRKSLEVILTDRTTDGPDGEFEYVVGHMDDSGEWVKRPRGQFVCQECGVIDTSMWETKPRERTLEDGERVVARLDEQNIDVDEDVFFGLLKRLKAKQDEQGSNWRVLGQATLAGVRAANMGRERFASAVRSDD